MTERAVKYESKTTRVVRGLEARSISKWVNDGWDLVEQKEASPVMTGLEFRREKKGISKKVWVSTAVTLVAVGGLITTGILIGDETIDDTAGAAEVAETPVESESKTSADTEPAVPVDTTVQDEPAQSDEDRTARFNSDLKFGLFVEDSYQELLSVDPTMWGGYISDARVKGNHAYITLQVDGTTPAGKEIGEQAAQAMSTLMTQETVDAVGYAWVIVEDGGGTVISQKQPSPIQ